MTMCWVSYIVIVAAFVLLVSTSGWLINYVLQQVTNKQLEEVANEDAPKEVQKRLNIGSIIGKCENILILVFLILEAYTALAIVVTAKTIVRKEEIEKNSMYFLAGTLINVSYSVLVGFILKLVLPLIKC
jgi:bacterioferritin-associated ferredoxin